jgi:hypothetical protein
MEKPKATIGKCIYEISTTSQDTGKELTMKFGTIAKERLSAIIEKVLDEVSSQGKIIKIDNLALDLGQVEYADLDQLEVKLEQELRKAIEKLISEPGSSKNVEIIDASQRYIDLIIYFLKTGSLPWWAKDHTDFKPSEILSKIKQLDDVSATHFVKQLHDDPIAVNRLIRQFKDEELFVVIKKISPGADYKIILYFFLKTLLTTLPKQRLPLSGIRDVVWQAIFSDIKEEVLERLIPKVFKLAAIANLKTEKELVVESLYTIFSDDKIGREFVPEVEKFKKVYERLVTPREIVLFYIQQERKFKNVEKFLKAVLPQSFDNIAQLVKDVQSAEKIVSGKVTSDINALYKKLLHLISRNEEMQADEHLAIQLLKEATVNISPDKAIQYFKEETISGKKLATSSVDEIKKKIEAVSSVSNATLDLKGIDAIASHDELLHWIDSVNEVVNISATVEKEKKAVQALLLILNFGFIPAAAEKGLGASTTEELEELITFLIQRKPEEVKKWISKTKFESNPLLPLILRKNYSEKFSKQISKLIPPAYHFQDKEWKKTFFYMVLQQQYMPWYYQGKNILTEASAEFKPFIEEEKVWIKKQIADLVESNQIRSFYNSALAPFFHLIDEVLYKGELKAVIEKQGKADLEAKAQAKTQAKVVESPKAALEKKSVGEEKSYSADKLAYLIKYMAVHKALPKEETIHPDAVFIFLIRKSPLTASFLLASLPEEELKNLVQMVSKDIREKIEKIVVERVRQEERDYRKFNEPLNLGEPVYIANAGLVLVHPFLQRFFTTLKLVEKRKFVSEEAQVKAAHLLHYLVYKKETPFEFDLLVNKILCGIDTNLPIEKDLPLTDEEKDLCESLLGGVIQNWAILKNTSPDNFRVSFLQREGKLYRQGGSWHVKVERKSYDILVDRLPWGLGMIKLPWMQDFINVDWT